MKNVVLISLLVCTLMSCKKEDLGAVYATLGQEIKLKESQVAVYNASAVETLSVLRVKLEGVSDSRCPSDVRCIRFGNVDVNLIYGTGGGNGEAVAMCLGDCGNRSISTDSAQVSVNNTRYLIRLLDVTPLPTFKRKTNSVKEVKITVERL